LGIVAEEEDSKRLQGAGLCHVLSGAHAQEPRSLRRAARPPLRSAEPPPTPQPQPPRFL